MTRPFVDWPLTTPVRYLKLLRLPYSEVCMHMKVAGQEMWGSPAGDLMVQLWDDEGRPFSFPITRGEAGWGLPENN
jgi:hypothetical protein